MNDLFTPEFSEWYARYPKKAARRDAQKAWDKLNAQERREACLDNLERRYGPVDRQFIPYPATYLRGARWEDDYPEPETKSTRERTLREDLTDTSWA